MWRLSLSCIVSLAAAERTVLADGWAIGSSATVGDGGQQVSQAGYHLETNAWTAVPTMPATVLGALADAGVYKDIYYDENMKTIPVEPFLPSWWYRTEFQLPPSALPGSRVRLVFKGINYRANVWLNGQQVGHSDTLMGTFRYFDVDITSAVQGHNALAVEVTRPYNSLVEGYFPFEGVNPLCPNRNTSECKDLAITWVDWGPTPPDFNMGIWRDVELQITGPVSVDYPMVNTTVDEKEAQVTVMAQVSNWDVVARTGKVHGSLGGLPLACEPVALDANSSKQVSCAPLSVPRSMLWWPWQMGEAVLHNLTLSFQTEAGAASDELVTRVGLRQITSELNSGDSRLFRVNGQPLLIRGGGWSPDLLLRERPDRQLQEMEYVRHLGLNTVRLEGKFQDDHLFDLADEMGILMLPGFCCCDSWQKWPEWEPEQYLVARESLRSQTKRLRGHASILGFIYSSDQLPPTDVEAMYLKVFEDEQWPNPTVSAAAFGTSELTGVSGVKMSGPYAYVPPSYWTDPAGEKNEGNRGGAFGFNTETSPGISLMPLESLERVTPKEKWWPLSDAWYYHTGANVGSFHDFRHFTPALDARYGSPSTAEDFNAKGQLMSYETQRAMFEAYSMSKYNATGIVQWMLNSAWPNHIWHLYDYFLNPAGSYFGAKKALEPLHIAFNYNRSSVWVVNSEYAAAVGPFVAMAEIRDPQTGKLLASQNQTVTRVLADQTKELFPVSLAPYGGPVFVRLTLTGSEGIVSSNVYWLTSSMDVVDWSECNFYRCDVARYADLSAFNSLSAPSLLPPVVRTVTLDATWAETKVTLVNPGSNVAFFVRLRLLKEDQSDVLPVLWSDNYVTLFPGETHEVRARFRLGDGPGVSVDVAPFTGQLSFVAV